MQIIFTNGEAEYCESAVFVIRNDEVYAEVTYECGIFWVRAIDIDVIKS